MRFVIISVLLLISTIIQTNIIGYIRMFGITPNLFIVIITGFALLGGPVEGAAVGFAAGFIQDVIIGNAIGGYSLIGMYVGLAVGIFNKRFVKDSLFVAIPFVFLTTVVYEIIFYLFSFYWRGENEILFATKNIILPESIYNSIITIIMFPIIVLIDQWIEEHTRNTRKY